MRGPSRSPTRTLTMQSGAVRLEADCTESNRARALTDTTVHPLLFSFQALILNRACPRKAYARLSPSAAKRAMKQYGSAQVTVLHITKPVATLRYFSLRG